MKQKHYFRSLLAGLAALLLTITATAQMRTTTGDEATWPSHVTFGVGAGANLNFAMGDYTIDGNTYSTGIGAGPAFYLLLEVPLATDWMLVPRLSYNNLSARFTDGSPGVFPAGSGATGSATDLAVNVQSLGADLLGKYSFSAFHVLFGPHVGKMISKSYAHGTSSAAASSNTDLPGTADIFASLGLGFGLDLPINARNTVWLTPEIFGSYPLTDLGNNSTLNIITVRGGLALKFDLNPAEEAPPPPPTAALEVSVTAHGVLPSGELVNEPVVPQQTTRSRVSMPLVPYVFFENGQSAIPTRYSTAGATGFSVESLQGRNEFDVNHELLNVIGARMKQYPTSSITVVGCNANSGVERNNSSLSRTRAMALRDYLVNTWGIDASRITIDQRNLPEIPTNPVTKAGMEENRRAEFQASDRRLLEPIKIENRTSEALGETVIRFDVTTHNQQFYNITGWRLTIDQNGVPIGMAQTGAGLPASPVTVNIGDASAYIDEPVHYQITLTDDQGRTYVADGMTRVVSRAVERDNLEKYAMLSFDFDRSEINQNAHEMLGLISESIARDATGVAINGYCDNTGTDEYNQALSEARASSAASQLRSQTTLPANTTVQGHGEQDPKFTNDLPEGRQLNRRVEVDIQKSMVSSR